MAKILEYLKNIPAEKRKKIAVIAAPASLVLLYLIFSYALNLDYSGLLIICVSGIFYISAFHLGKKYIDKKKSEGLTPRIERLTTFVLGLFMPVTGILLNYALGNLFGNFLTAPFLLIAIFNGIILLAPDMPDSKMRLLFFYLKSVGYAYILYFFIVFLPILPVAVVALAAIIGVYGFAPLAITIWQGKILIKDYKVLKTSYKPLTIILIGFLGIFTIPLTLYTVTYHDMKNLQNAAIYVNPSGKGEKPPVNFSRLKSSLDFIGSNYYFKDLGMFNFSENSLGIRHTPILSALYREHVLKNLSISDENIQLMRNIFFDTNMKITNNIHTVNSSAQKDVKLTKAWHNTTYDKNNNVYRSWINLELKNGDMPLGEYLTEFHLPDGAYISNYYLDVFGERKYGLLTDRRAAIFVYNRIVRQGLDPGILYYKDLNTIELRVFPFAESEIRTTGFEIMHQSGFDLKLDNKTLHLNGANGFEQLELKNVTLLSAGKIKNLPEWEGESVYSFIIDCSKDSNVPNLVQRILDYTNSKGIDNANIYFTSYKAEAVPLNEINNAKYTKQGGFNLQIAVREILDSADVNHIPVIIVVTEDMSQAILPTAINYKGFPQIQNYYVLQSDLLLAPYSLKDNQKSVLSETSLADFNGSPVLNNGEPQLIAVKNGAFGPTGNQYEDALLLHAGYMDEMSTGQISVSHIINSLRSKVLTPATAFIVLETEQQEKELLAKQADLLNGGPADVPSLNLSEPHMSILFLIVLALYFSVYTYKRVRTSHYNK